MSVVCIDGRKNKTRSEREVLDRQDLVDNAVHHMLETLLDSDMDWNIQIIGNVRDAILEKVEFHNLGCADELYPFIEEKDQYEQNAPRTMREGFAGMLLQFTADPVKFVLEFFGIAVLFFMLLFVVPLIAGAFGR